MKKFKINLIDLNMFEGGAAAGVSGDGGSGGMGETTNASSAAKGKSGDLSNVKYGIQDDGDAGQNGVQVTSNTLEERRKAYNQFKEEYKDFYTEETQNMINRRFKETKNLEKQVNEFKPLLDMLSQRYKAEGVENIMKALENDDAYWEEAAYEAGMTVETFKEFQELKRQNKEYVEKQAQAATEAKVNEQLESWFKQAEELKAVFPTFDFNTELQNDEFVQMLRNGTPVEHAYKVIHLDEITSDIMRSTAQMTEKRVVNNIRSRGNRPVESSISSQSAFTVKNDPRKFDREDRAEIVRRAARGEIIRLS